jgi:hypothetical protein
MLRESIRADILPDYIFTEEPGDIICVTPRAVVIEPGEGPILSPETLDTARALRPGEDVYALEARWRGVWAATGRPRLRAPDKAFLGWLKAPSSRS